MTRRMRPSASRSVPITGWLTSLTSSPRALSSSDTESTRNGESSQFVSTTVPTVWYPSSASVGLKHAYRKRRRPPPVGQVERAHDLAEQLLGVQARDEVGRDPPDVRPRELPDGGQTARRHAFGDPREQLLHERARAGGFALIPGARHASSTA